MHTDSGFARSAFMARRRSAVGVRNEAPARFSTSETITEDHLDTRLEAYRRQRTHRRIGIDAKFASGR
jgi:hypothetical protein